MEECEARQLVKEMNDALAHLHQIAYVHRTPVGWEIHLYWVIDLDQRFTSVEEARGYLEDVG